MKRIFALACTIAGLGGCASITGSDMQSLLVETVDSSGATVSGAECRLSNNKGTWVTKSPGSVVVNRSGEDLQVRCTAEGYEPGLVKAVSRINGGMVGNIVFGGVIGAVVDNSGAGYDYPQRLRVMLGAVRVVDKRDEAPGSTPTPDSIASTPPSAAPAPASAKPVSATTMDDLNDLLPPQKP